MSSFDVITVGAGIIDAFLQMQPSENHWREDAAAGEICIKHGQKVQVDSCQFLLGGNACNVAVGLARLGFSAALCAETGDDEFSDKLIRGLIKEGVVRDLVRQTPNTQASFAIGLNFNSERTLFVSHTKRTHAFSFEQVMAKWVYLTSLGEEWKQAYQATVNFVKAKNINLVFAPGTRQLQAGREKFQYVFPVSQLVILNKEEAQRILEGAIDNDAQNEIKRLLTGLQALGSKMVVITDGMKGSYALSEQGDMFHLGIFDHPVVERTGAGDAYATGFVAALMQGLSIENAMQWGTLNAAAVVGKVGAQAGLLKKEEMEAMKKQHVDFVAKKL